MRNDEQRKKNREYMRARYEQRKAAGVCTECGGTRENTRRVRCDYCHDLDRASHRRRYGTKAYLRKERARGKRLRKQRRADGRCAHCNEPALRGTMCDYHRERAVRATREWRARQRAGVAAQPKFPAAPLSVISMDDYRPVDEIERSPRIKLLRVLIWADWLDPGEIFLRAGFEDDAYSRERNSAQITLGRLVKYGLVERRKTQLRAAGQDYDYRITAAGRDEVKAFRRGEIRQSTRGRRAA